MESRTVVKVVGAFLAGVLLTLGAAIVHSRQSAVTSAIRPVTAQQSATVNPRTSEPAVAHQRVPEERVEPAVPAGISPPPTSKRKSLPAGQKNPVQVSSRAGDMHPSVAGSQPVGQRPQPTTNDGARDRNPWSVPVPPPPADPVQSPVRTSLPAEVTKQAVEPHVVTLPAGTTLAVRLGERLSSDRSNGGDTFQATLDAPVVSEGFVIAERRSQVVGRVIEANRAGRVKGVANLALALSEINTTDGQRVPVETDSYEKWGTSSRKSDTAKVAGAAALGAIIGAIAGGGKGAAIGAGAGGAAGTGVALGTRGAAVSIPSESVLTFRLARPITITEKFN